MEVPLTLSLTLSLPLSLSLSLPLSGVTPEGKEVFLRDVWPSREEVQQMEEDTVVSSIFQELNSRMEVRS